MSWQEETSERKEKIQDISEEKGAPQTTKQTVTLTTVAGQKAQEKENPWIEQQATKKKHYRDQIIIVKILVYLTFQESPLRLYDHDSHTGYTTETTTSWLQTNPNSTSDYDRQFSNQCDV